jgi:CheY-like chemotaxis protein
VVADFAAMQAKKRSAALAALSILIADDDADTMLTLSELLRDEGHVVHTCANASFVLEAIERYKPKVCILDIVMPRKTGFALAREIMAMKLAKRPVLIALTGVFAQPADEVAVLGAGFDHVMSKSSSPDELLRLLEEIAAPPRAA